MRPLIQINWFQLVKTYQWLRIHGYFPDELKRFNPFAQTKEKYVELFAYVMEHLSEKKMCNIPLRYRQLYNWIFMDECVQEKRTGVESSYSGVVKNSRFGHEEGTQAYIIDEMLCAGRNSYFDIAKAIGSSESRVRNHTSDLKRKFGDIIEIVAVRKGRHYVYYIKEKKKSDPKREGYQPVVRTFDDIGT